jgi:O-antigen ligase
VLLVVYAVIIGGGYGGIQSVAIRSLSLILVAVGLVGWWIAAWRWPDWRPGTTIWPAVVLPPTALLLGTLLSQRPRLGMEYVAWSVLLAALYLLLVRILHHEDARVRIGGLATLLGFVIGLLYLAVVVREWLTWWEALGRLAVPPLRPSLAGLPLGGPNLVASSCVLLTVIAVAGVGTRTRARRVTLGLLVATTAVVVLLTGSRSAWLAVAISVAVVGALWLILERDTIGSRLGGRLSGGRGLAIVGVALAVAAVAAVAVGPAMLDRFLNAGDGGRPSFFAAALRMWQAAPLLGHGPGTWAAERTTWLAPGELDYVVPHAHDLYLQTLAELGIAGLLVGAAAIGSVLWLAIGALRTDDGRRRAWAWAILVSGLYLAVVNVVDLYANLPGLLLLAVIPVAMLDSLSDRGLGVPGRFRPVLLGRLAVAVLWVGCLASTLVLAWAESTAFTHARAVAAADAGDWPNALARAEAAVMADPAEPPHQLTLALAAMHEGEWQVAAEAYQRLLAVDDLPQAWLGLALATLEAGGPVSAVDDALGSAMRMGQQHAHISLAVGEVYDRLGLTAQADEAYVHALVQQPALAADPAWGSRRAPGARFPAVLDEAIDRLGPQAWRLPLMAGDTDRARELAVERDAPDTSVGPVTDLIDAWDGDAAALGRIEERVEADPTSAGALATAALLVSRAGDQPAAERYRRLAAAVTEGVPLLSAELRTAPACTAQRVPVAADLYGQHAFRRPTPRDLTPPGVSCLVTR